MEDERTIFNDGVVMRMVCELTAGQASMLPSPQHTSPRTMPECALRQPNRYFLRRGHHEPRRWIAHEWNSFRMCTLKEPDTAVKTGVVKLNSVFCRGDCIEHLGKSFCHLYLAVLHDLRLDTLKAHSACSVEFTI